MPLKKYLLLNLAFLLPLWFLEAHYACSHRFPDYDSEAGCALIVYVCIITVTIFFRNSLRSPAFSQRVLARTTVIAMLTPILVNLIGWWVAHNFFSMGAEL
jgi:cytochrome bd-type quinol oxidase subunit 1